MNRISIENVKDKTGTNIKNILIVDDDSLNLKLIEFYFRELGFQNISVAKNGNDAITKLKIRFDLILLDIGLPDISGIELCIQIRKSPLGKKVPIIAITAFDDDVEEKCIAAGMNDYIRKPLTIISIENIINQFV